MSKSNIILIIAVAAILIMFIWGYLDTFQHSWLIFLVAGAAIAVVSNVYKDKEKDKPEDKNDENDGNA